ncbi:MAG: transcriptional regulator [Gammaproteobacteria bacterium HGW-Gammaproteobacteria-8]|nr:MAG: transcriptional regulator [Gammaproteobacteria bacterium HGW-Gammaproteobacteria-8]
MRIGQLARRTGCQIETIRYYERVGILPEPERTENNYRQYGAAHQRRLGFVRRCRDLGFSLDEVRTLLGMIEGEHRSCAEVETVAQQHLEAVRAKIADLGQMEARLSELVARCDGGNTPDCSFLEALFDARSEA